MRCPVQLGFLLASVSVFDAAVVVVVLLAVAVVQAIIMTRACGAEPRRSPIGTEGLERLLSPRLCGVV